MNLRLSIGYMEKPVLERQGAFTNLAHSIPNTPYGHPVEHYSGLMDTEGKELPSSMILDPTILHSACCSDCLTGTQCKYLTKGDMYNGPLESLSSQVHTTQRQCGPLEEMKTSTSLSEDVLESGIWQMDSLHSSHGISKMLKLEQNQLDLDQKVEEIQRLLNLEQVQQAMKEMDQLPAMIRTMKNNLVCYETMDEKDFL